MADKALFSPSSFTNNFPQRVNGIVLQDMDKVNHCIFNEKPMKVFT